MAPTPTWECDTCGFDNVETLDTCELCGEPRYGPPPDEAKVDDEPPIEEVEDEVPVVEEAEPPPPEEEVPVPEEDEKEEEGLPEDIRGSKAGSFSGSFSEEMPPVAAPPVAPPPAPAVEKPRRVLVTRNNENRSPRTKKPPPDRPVVASFTVASEQGMRKNMEDVYMVNGSVHDDPEKSYFAVFDGHAGSRAAEYCGQRMLDNITSTAAWRRGDVKEAVRYGMQRTEQAYLRSALTASPRWFDGTTAVCCLVVKKAATIGWVGDSRAVLGRCVEGQWSAIGLSKDHKPMDPNEHDRILASGGSVGRSLKEANARNVTAVAGSRCPVFCFGAHPTAPMRCYPGGLSLSRSIGDVTLKYHAVKCVIGEPEVVVHHVDPTKDRFVILGCDGIWDVLTNDDAVNVVANAASNKKDPARALVKAAAGAGSTDNMTAVVVRIARNVNKTAD